MTNPRDASGEWPAEGLEAVAACPVCGSADKHVMYAGLRDRAFRAAPGSWTLMRCGECRSAYLDPRPTRDTIELAYRSYYTHSTAIPGSPAGGIREGLAGDYRRARWGYAAGRAIPGGRLVGRLAPSRGALVGRDVRHLVATPGGRLLDVGCGSGAFLAQMEALGWRADGIDPDPEAVAGARRAGLSAMHGTLRDLNLTDRRGRYDAVTLSHVIEHLHDLSGELRLIRDLLRPSGLIWMATPNLDGLGLRRFGRDWINLDPPRHLVLFNRTSLERVLKEAGFEPLEQPPPSPQALQVFSQSAAIREGRLPDEGPADGPGLLRPLAAIANWLALRNPSHAEELVVIAKRRSY